MKVERYIEIQTSPNGVILRRKVENQDQWTLTLKEWLADHLDWPGLCGGAVIRCVVEKVE